MKPTYILFTLIVVLCGSLSSKESEALPDLTKAFPQEKLLQQTKISGIETYSYSTNLSFADLKKQFIKFLGKGWTEPKVDPEAENTANEAMKQQRMTALEGNVLFSNPAYPDIQIGLTQMRMKLEGKKFLANITVLGKK